jgi:hypothetical protein
LLPQDILQTFGTTGSTTRTFFYLFYCWQTVLVMGLPVVRNQGIFWEPGVLQIFLNLLLYLELFYFENNKGKIIFLLLAILFTISSTGYVIASFLLLVYGIKNGYIKIRLKSLVTAIPIASVGGFFLYTNLMQKLSLENSISLAYRLFDIEKSLDIINKHYLLGLGFSPDVFTQYAYDSKLLSLSGGFIQNSFISDAGNTNSVLMLYVSFGLIVASIYLICIFRQTLFDRMPGMVFVYIIIFCFSEPLITNNFFLLIFLSGMVRLLGTVKLASCLCRSEYDGTPC